MAVETSIIVEFEGDSADDGSVVIEIDEAHPNNLNADGDIKDFSPLDRPVFLVNYDHTVEIYDIQCTDGSVSLISQNIIRPKKMTGLFTDLDSVIDISYNGVVPDSDNYIWYGNQANPFLETSSIKLHADGNTLPAFSDIVYEVVFNRQYEFIPPQIDIDPDDTYPVYIVVYARRVS